MDTKNFKKNLQSKQFKKIVISLCIAVIALMIFSVGMEVGYMKASFSYRFGDSYYKTFGAGNTHINSAIIPGGLSDAHGVSGKIVSLNLPNMIVADKDNTEKSVQLEKETVIRELRNTIQSSGLKTGDFVIVIGEPNEGSAIDAKFIRVIPEPPTQAVPTASPPNSQN